MSALPDGFDVLRSPVQRTWRSAGLTLRYRLYDHDGSAVPARPLVILHHGWLDQGASWGPVADRLARDFRVVVPDARGHGDSDWVGPGGAYWFPDYLLDLHNLVLALRADGLMGAESIDLIGHSMGGSVAAYFAGTFPEDVRRLVLIEGLGPPSEGPGLVAARLHGFVSTTRAAWVKRDRVHATKDRADGDDAAPADVMAGQGDAARRLMQADRLLAAPVALWLAGLATRPAPGGNGWIWKSDPLHKARSGMPFVIDHARELWSRIAAPTLVIDAERGFPAPDRAERLALIRDHRAVTLPHVGHNVHLHDPARLAALISAHLLPMAPLGDAERTKPGAGGDSAP
ncbi:MAG: alpha/beta fold hydrolase [Myxococcales bacterium]|nr:alpha/beta fold hydrolase [Myxococcales bacterium]